MRGVFLDTTGLDDLDLGPLQRVCDELRFYPTTSADETAARIDGAQLVIVNKVPLNRDILLGAKDLRLICLVATGTDNIDLQTARERNITVCNCRAYGTASVVQQVFASLLALVTNLLKYHAAVKDGRWQQAQQFCLTDYPISELSGKTLGIVGYGTLGKGVAKIARAFDMEILVSARPGSVDDKRPALQEILPQIDVLTLHCPLTDTTRNLIDADALSRMKPEALLLNFARGGLVVEEALVAALQKGIIAGAAVDVLTIEPPRRSNILLDTTGINLIVTPHIAWASREARNRIVRQTVENISGFLTGNPQRTVT